MPLPTRLDVKERLGALVAGQISPEEASAWALSYINDDSDPYDKIVWDALVTIGSADLTGFDRPYLFVVEDFEGWLFEFNSKIDPANKAGGTNDCQ